MISRDEQAYLVRAWHASQDATSTPEAQQMIAAEQARIHQAFRQLPIQVQFVDHDPYASFEQMRDQVRSTGQMLVYKGSSETPLWTPQTNWMARAVHDWDHIVRSCDFSMEGEAAAYRHAAACRPGLAPLYLSEIMLQAAIANYQGAFVPQKLVLAPENVRRRATQMRGVEDDFDMFDVEDAPTTPSNHTRASQYLHALKPGDALPAKGFRVESVYGATVYVTKGAGRKLYWLTPAQLEPEIIFALQEVTPGSGTVIPGPPAATFKLQGGGNLRGGGAVDYQQLIRLANEASRSSRYRGPQLSPQPSREELLYWLAWNDRNGVFTDEQIARDPEFAENGPLSEEVAWELLEEMLADDLAEQGLRGVGRRPAGDPQAELVWSTSGILRVSTPEMAMVHLAAKGVGPEDALVIVVAAQMLNNEVDAEASAPLRGLGAATSDEPIDRKLLRVGDEIGIVGTRHQGQLSGTITAIGRVNVKIASRVRFAPDGLWYDQKHTVAIADIDVVMRNGAVVFDRRGLHSPKTQGLAGTGPLQLGEPVLDQIATDWLHKAKRLRSRRSDNLLNSALESAAAFAKKYKQETYVYEGNSYMQRVFHVTNIRSKALNRINNTGAFLFYVTPDLHLYRQEILREGYI